MVVEEFHNAKGGNDFKNFWKYLTDKGIRIIEVEQIDVHFSDSE